MTKEIKEITFDILKRNRVYFDALMLIGDYDTKKARILIDKNSESLQLGKQTLMVEHIGVTNKYGMELKYKLAADIEEQKEESGFITFQHDLYNEILNEKCKKLLGKWDPESKCWNFKEMFADEVEKLEEYYNSPKKVIDIKFVKDCTFGDELHFKGYDVIKAIDKETLTKMKNPFVLVQGNIYSGGSWKYPNVIVKEGAVLRAELPGKVIEDIIAKYKDDQDIEITYYNA